MASLVHQASLPPPPPATACDDEFTPRGFTCFGRSLSRSSSSSRLEYRALRGEERRVAALHWKAVAHELLAKGAAARRRRKQQRLAVFSYDSRNYALNFDRGDAE